MSCVSVRTGSKMGISPLMLAAMNGHTAAVKLLLDMGSDINAQVDTRHLSHTCTDFIALLIQQFYVVLSYV